MHVAEFEELEEAIEWNNAVPQGLSSSLWTRDVRNVGRWIGPEGSDTGIVNVSFFFTFSVIILFAKSRLLGRSTLARAGQKSVLRLEVTRAPDGTRRFQQISPYYCQTYKPFSGAVNLEVMLGNSMYAGVLAPSTFRTLLHWRRA